MYGEFSGIYDLFMDDFDYPAWAEYYIELMHRAGYDDGELCECGCGTGSLSCELARMGYTLTCSDLSEDMLRAAQQKARRFGKRIRFVRQDMREIRLPHRVSGILAACDCVNYLTTEDDVLRFLTSARAALKDGGVLAFDISSPYKLREVLGNNLFGEERETAAYLWRNTYHEENCSVDLDITFFVKQPGGLFRRFDEQQTQRAYTPQSMLELLGKAGFSSCAAWGDRTFDPPADNELRLHFTAVR